MSHENSDPLLSEGFGEQLINLEVLVLKNCHKLGSLPESISGLKALKVLDLSSDATSLFGDIIPMSLQSLPERFGDLTSLEDLNLGGCKSLLALPISFCDLSNLKTLVLGQGGFGGAGAHVDANTLPSGKPHRATPRPDCGMSHRSWHQGPRYPALHTQNYRADMRRTKEGGVL